MQYPLKKITSLAGVILAGFLFLGASNSANSNTNNNNNSSANTVIESLDAVVQKESSAIFNEMHLDQAGLNLDVFSKAMYGLAKLSKKGTVKKDELLTIVDFSQPSNRKRLYVIDLDDKELLFNTLVAHGRNTGALWAKSFSNQPSSLKSSPGFYTTAETYYGSNGYSLRLDGHERNINSNARNRAIVMHGAPYVNPSTIKGLGFIGRSWGCPAVPMNEHRQIINTIKDGSVLFIYAPDQNYISHSTILNS